jgi:hypothetical protein
MANAAVDQNVAVPSDLEDRLRAVERITQLFRLERMVYLGCAVGAFAALLFFLVMIFIHQEQSVTASLGAFGSSGVVAYTSSRVLMMWSRAMNIVAAPRSGEGGSA